MPEPTTDEKLACGHLVTVDGCPDCLEHAMAHDAARREATRGGGARAHSELMTEHVDLVERNERQARLLVELTSDEGKKTLALADSFRSAAAACAVLAQTSAVSAMDALSARGLPAGRQPSAEDVKRASEMADIAEQAARTAQVLDRVADKILAR